MIIPLSYSVVAKFEPPDGFLSQLESQVYGPTTHLIASDVSVLPLCLIQFVQLCYYHQITLIAKPLIIQLV